MQKIKYLSYEEAEKLSKKQKFRTSRHFREWGKRPANMPASPEMHYKNDGWTTWYKFLGTKNTNKTPEKSSRISQRMATYKEASNIASEKGIKTADQYIYHWKDRPENIPQQPNQTYAGRGWKGWKQFLNTEKISYKKLQKLCIKQKIRTQKELYESDLMDQYHIPNNLSQSYKEDGFTNFKSMIGGRFISYKEASLYMQKKHPEINTSTIYIVWSKDRPNFIPGNPKRTYADEWISWSDYFGI